MLNLSKIDIGWVPVSFDNNVYQHDLDLLYSEPEKLKVQNNGLISECPAHVSFVNKFFIVRAPFDLELEYDQETNYVFSKNLTQEQYNRFIFPRFNDKGDDNKLNITVNWSILFVADEDCTVEIYPAFMHNCPFNVSIGSFNCYKWQRPIDFTFQIEKNVSIKKGDPLYYVSFRTPKDKSVNFKRLEWNDELQKSIDQCNINKLQKKLSWSLIKRTGNILRPKRFIK